MWAENILPDGLSRRGSSERSQKLSVLLAKKTCPGSRPSRQGDRPDRPAGLQGGDCSRLGSRRQRTVRHAAQKAEGVVWPHASAGIGRWGLCLEDNLAFAKEHQVKDTAFAKKRGLSILDMAKSAWVYKTLRNFRAGIEAGISVLKRAFGLDRCTSIKGG